MCAFRVQAITAAEQRGRNEGLEEAAKVCLSMADAHKDLNDTFNDKGLQISASHVSLSAITLEAVVEAIRALKHTAGDQS